MVLLERALIPNRTGALRGLALKRTAAAERRRPTIGGLRAASRSTLDILLTIIVMEIRQKQGSNMTKQ